MVVKTIKIYFDGACNNHLEDPPAGVGVAVFFEDVYEEEYSKAIPIYPQQLGIRNTNNTTEWQGCIEAMKTLQDIILNITGQSYKYEVYSDSQVVTQVFNGRHQTHTPDFRKFNKQAHKIIDSMLDVKIIWVPRELNKQADKLSKEGIKIASQQKQSN